MVAQKNHTLLRDNPLHRQSITPTEHPTMATYHTSYISANHARLAAYILETLVILWHKSLKSEHTNYVHWQLQPGSSLTPKLPTCSRTKIKAHCEHGNIINIHYLHQWETIEQQATEKITTYRLSPELNTWTLAATANKGPASAGTLGEKGPCWPSTQVLAP